MLKDCDFPFHDVLFMMKEDVIRAFKVYENVETDTRMTKALNVRLKVILETI